jgi:hypothetical protein
MTQNTYCFSSTRYLPSHKLCIWISWIGAAFIAIVQISSSLQHAITTTTTTTTTTTITRPQDPTIQPPPLPLLQKPVITHDTNCQSYPKHDSENEHDPLDAYFTTIQEWPIPEKPKSIAMSRNQQSSFNNIPIVNKNHTLDNNKNNNSTNITTTTYWCIIGRDSNSKNARRFFTHFPHAAEALLPCWSWWRRWKVVSQCGIILLDDLYLPRDSWHHQLVHLVWKCSVERFRLYREPRQLRLQQSQPPNRTHPLGDHPFHIYYTPSLYWKNPRYGYIRYLDRPQDAWALRRYMISDSEIVKWKQGVLQIGILQRSQSRSILHLPQLLQYLQTQIPDANLTVLHSSSSAFVSIHQQAHWFATKDIIIGSHGAAMMNCLFIVPKTIVMQLYPPNYFFQSLEPLIELVGGIALDWYEGTDPHYDWRRAVRDRQNNQVRDANITLTSFHEIVDPILFTMGRKFTPSGWENTAGVSGTNWSKVLNWMQ